MGLKTKTGTPDRKGHTRKTSDGEEMVADLQMSHLKSRVTWLSLANRTGLAAWSNSRPVFEAVIILWRDTRMTVSIKVQVSNLNEWNRAG